MPKEVLIAESVLLVWLIGLVLWQRPKRKWTLRPRTPDDWMDCRLAQAEQDPSRAEGPRPWREVKSKRGRAPKHDSHGNAGMDTRWEYYKVTDGRIDA